MKTTFYGLKKAPRAWYSHIASYLTQNGFQRSENESTVYTKFSGQGNMLIVCMYVDDFILEMILA